VRGHDALVGRSIAGGADDGHPVVAAFYPTLRFAPTFSDEGDDDRVGGATGNGRLDQRRLAGTGRAEESDASASADCEQTVDNAYSSPKRSCKRYAIVGAWRTQLYSRQGPAQQRSSVERYTVGVDRATERARSERARRRSHAAHAASAASSRASSVRSIVPHCNSRRTSPGVNELSGTRSIGKAASAAQSCG
jgi:hypothetical protein